MFTGIVKAVGTVAQVERRGGDMRVTVTAPDLRWQGYQRGESICINGVCLTAVDVMEKGFETDISTETLNVSALSTLAPGQRVNIEPALALGERLGGHLVSGHIDCVGLVRSVRHDARSLRMEIEIPAEFARYAARKGSVCVDGVSLTINAVSANVMSLNIIPHTAESTIIGGYVPGTRVNIEVDLLARYLERLLSGEANGGISIDRLREQGYAK